jgi:hypothetical protein
MDTQEKYIFFKGFEMDIQKLLFEKYLMKIQITETETSAVKALHQYLG